MLNRREVQGPIRQEPPSDKEKIKKMLVSKLSHFLKAEINLKRAKKNIFGHIQPRAKIDTLVAIERLFFQAIPKQAEWVKFWALQAK